MKSQAHYIISYIAIMILLLVINIFAVSYMMTCPLCLWIFGIFTIPLFALIDSFLLEKASQLSANFFKSPFRSDKKALLIANLMNDAIIAIFIVIGLLLTYFIGDHHGIKAAFDSIQIIGGSEAIFYMLITIFFFVPIGSVTIIHCVKSLVEYARKPLPPKPKK